GQGRIDDARARDVEAAGPFFQGFDQLIAMARLLGEQRQDDQLQVGGVELAAGAETAAEHAAFETFHAVPPVRKAHVFPFAASAAVPLRPAAVEHFVFETSHEGTPLCQYYIVRDVVRYIS